MRQLNTEKEVSKLLPKAMVSDILAYLERPAKAPTLRYLNQLVGAYLRLVPWESVSRIIKHRTTTSIAACPRWPEEFWLDAMKDGFGGTCFESSLAFYALLAALGYEGYLTVNDMGETRACHAAIVVLLKGSKYLVDITIPVHVALRIDPLRPTRRSTTFHNYSLHPLGTDTYELRRSHHPHRVAFTLIDVPVSLPDFQKIVMKDYSETGFFLRSVVVVKTIDDRVWRFFSDRKPYQLESFSRAGRSETFLAPETPERQLASIFHLPQSKLAGALSWV